MPVLADRGLGGLSLSHTTCSSYTYSRVHSSSWLFPSLSSSIFACLYSILHLLIPQDSLHQQYININDFCSIFLFSGYIFRNFLCLEIYWTPVLALSLNFYPRVLFFDTESCINVTVTFRTCRTKIQGNRTCFLFSQKLALHWVADRPALLRVHSHWTKNKRER